MAQQQGFRKLTFQKHAVLLEEGRAGDNVYLIVSGKVEIRKGIRKKSPQVLGIRGPGEVIGEMAILDDHPHMATAVALQKTIVTAMSRQEVRARVEAMDPIIKGMIAQLIKRAREMADLLMAKPAPVNWHDWKRPP